MTSVKPRGAQRVRRWLSLIAAVTILASGLSLGAAPAAQAAGPLAPVDEPRAAAFSSEERYVIALYAVFLGRAPSSQELAASVVELRQGGRYQLTTALATSTEWAGVVVDGIYQDALDRPADPDGRRYWVGLLDGGTQTRDISVFIYASPEAVAAAGSTAGYVDSLYRRVLGRGPDPEGHAFWVESLDQGTSPAAIVAAFWDSEEFRRQRVERTYQSVLDRGPDPSGWSYWAALLLQVDEVRLAADLAASDEFFQRAQHRELPDIPTPSAPPRPVSESRGVLSLLGDLRLEPERSVTYDRDQWRHWSDLGPDFVPPVGGIRDGCNTRCEVLKIELIPDLFGPDQPGYYSLYDGKTFTPDNASSLDLDHMVPLAEAARSGGQEWSPAMKEAFANDLALDASLILVSNSTNRSKGDRDPAHWMPPAADDPAVRCAYLLMWVQVKWRWDLSVDPAESDAIRDHAVASNC